MTWLWTIAAKKAVSRAVQLVIAVIGSQKVGAILHGAGVTITIDPVLASAATFGLLEFLRNWLKNKVGVKYL